MSALLEAIDLAKRYPVQGGGSSWSQRLSGGKAAIPQLHAVDGVSFRIERGETVGLVGESGCGKSTLVRLLTRLIDASGGSILFDDAEIGATPARAFVHRPERALIQMVFQDAGESLNPRHTAFAAIADPLRRLAGLRERSALVRRIDELADLVALPRELLTRYPHQLSGGQKARVGIARAIAVSPKLLVLDEPTAALDVSVQVVILRLLADLKERLGMSYLFVSHDLNLVRLLCDRVLVMYLGKIVESGPADEIFRYPMHPYTKALLSAIPSADAAVQHGRIRLAGEARSPIDPSPTVCRFQGRCPRSRDRCAEAMPALETLTPGHAVACHFPEPVPVAPLHDVATMQERRSR